MTYTDEIFTLSDGGTLLLQWSICEDGKQSKRKINIAENGDEIGQRKNPLLILINGLSGGSSNLYQTNLVIEAHKNNYDCVFVNYRCLAGLEPTVIFKTIK